MRKLVIGCGYLGRRVAALWRAAGDQVFATTRHGDEADRFRAEGLEPIVCDVLDLASLAVLPQVDTVVYAIGFDRSSGATMRAVYVDGLANVLDRIPPPSRFIYISSSSVYGQSDGGWVDEDWPTEPKEESGQVVLDAERTLFTSSVRRRLRTLNVNIPITLRFAGIYGPGRLLRRVAIEKGEPIVGDADKWLNLIHVDDGARVILAAEARGTAGRIYNVCDGAPVRRRDFFAELARLLGAPVPQFVAPPTLGELPAHESANRCICNERMIEELQTTVRYPSYVEGLAASV
jgi:nucleoside-diphosphate-sugar epimerase